MGRCTLPSARWPRRRAKSPRRLHAPPPDRHSLALCTRRFVVGVLLQNHEVLQYGRDRNVLFRCKFCAVLVVKQHWRGACLKPSDLLWPTRKPCNIDRLADPHGNLQLLEVLVQGNEPSRAHSGHKMEKQVMALAEDGVLQ